MFSFEIKQQVQEKKQFKNNGGNFTMILLVQVKIQLQNDNLHNNNMIQKILIGPLHNLSTASLPLRTTSSLIEPLAT
jgi:hypothetical protein